MTRTRNSELPDVLTKPYLLNIAWIVHDGLIHSGTLLYGDNAYNTCCRARPWQHEAPHLARGPTCFACIQCKGCVACNPKHVRPELLELGKWETMDRRRLYPFEMDSTHLMNAIAKLIRDKNHFKDDWRQWVKILNVEASLRGLL